MAGELPSGCRQGEAPAAWLLGGSGNWNDAVQLNAAVGRCNKILEDVLTILKIFSPLCPLLGSLSPGQPGISWQRQPSPFGGRLQGAARAPSSFPPRCSPALTPPGHGRYQGGRSPIPSMRVPVEASLCKSYLWKKTKKRAVLGTVTCCVSKIKHAALCRASCDARLGLATGLGTGAEGGSPGAAGSGSASSALVSPARSRGALGVLLWGSLPQECHQR
ncbi:uncharacterized protein LOC142361946 isoform X1 [Opisthocomus hoazin]|uniref:uncharacterized protein LOC142361946 isoform X1 n=1 Tax=Opisthocomus hoazin TaxID=30419 RepID=UPI003F52EFA2